VVRRPALAAFAVAGVVLAPNGRDAGAGSLSDAYEGIAAKVIDFHAFLDAYASTAFNTPEANQGDLNVDDPSSGVGLAWVRARIAHRPGPVGFLVDLGAGETSDAFLAEDPANVKHHTYARVMSHVAQAFVTAVVPVGHGLEIDVGKFVTPVGFEEIESWTNWNYSRSLVYEWAEPSVHTGVRLTYPVSRQVTLAAFWLDGWDANLVDGNGMRSFATAAQWRPGPGFELDAVYMAGLEHPPLRPGGLSLRNLGDLYASYWPNHFVGFAVSTDAGIDEGIPGDAKFGGVAAYARLQPEHWLAFSARLERYYDREGFTTSLPQILDEGTLTAELKVDRFPVKFTTRFEYRHDESSSKTYDPETGFLARKDSLILSVLALY